MPVSDRWVSHRSSSSCRGFFPIRTGGFDQTRSNVVPEESRRSSAVVSVIVSILLRPSLAPFFAVSASARSLTSTAQTVAAGDFVANTAAIGPHPQPRSKNVPVGGGGGTVSRRTLVPASRPDEENTWSAVSIGRSRPQTWMRTERVSDGFGMSLLVK